MRTYQFDELCPYIREAGMQRRDSWKSFPRRIFDHQFFFCFKGTANMQLGEKLYKIKSGQLFIVPPSTPHNFWVEKDEEGELYWFHCDLFCYPDREWVNEYYKGAEYVALFGKEMPYPEHARENPIFENGWKLPETLLLENPSEMEYQFRSIQKVYSQQNPYWRLSARSNFMEIFTTILNETLLLEPKNLRHSHIINQIKTTIALNYYRKLSVPEICADTGLNAEYASKAFKQKTGQRLVEYLNQYRLNKAKKLLIDRDLSIADISEMVGFSSENYFCSVMKKYEGQTPEALRSYLITLMQQDNVL